jgi:hypothetical protein
LSFLIAGSNTGPASASTSRRNGPWNVCVSVPGPDLYATVRVCAGSRSSTAALSTSRSGDRDATGKHGDRRQQRDELDPRPTLLALSKMRR